MRSSTPPGRAATSASVRMPHVSPAKRSCLLGTDRVGDVCGSFGWVSTACASQMLALAATAIRASYLLIRTYFVVHSGRVRRLLQSLQHWRLHGEGEHFPASPIHMWFCTLNQQA